MILYSELGEVARVDELPGPRFRLTCLESPSISYLRPGDWIESAGIRVRVGDYLTFVGPITASYEMASAEGEYRGTARVLRIEPLPPTAAGGCV